jgi:Zn-dependent M28 family amino/carboxypeptidase
MKGLILVLLVAVARSQSVPVNFLAQEVVETRLRSYTTKNATREPAVRTLFEEAGCKADALVEQSVKGTKSPNLICTLKGTTDSTIIVGAHFDLVERGHGVVDNWSGVSLLPSFYQGLSANSRKHTFVLVAFAGEEQGLLGSQFFVKQMGTQKSQVKAMINLDTLGLGQTMVWLSHSDRSLVAWLNAIAKQLNIPLGAVDVEKVGTTDSEPFREKKIPAITVHSLTQSTLRILHSPQDKIEAIHLDEYYQSYRLLIAYLAAIDQKLD